MAQHEVTLHGTSGDTSATLMYAKGHVLIEAVRPVPPRYPSAQPGVERITVALPIEQFLAGVDAIVGAVANDPEEPATLRAEVWRGDFSEVSALAGAAAVEDAADLTRAQERAGWVLDRLGIGSANWQLAAAEEKARDAHG